MDGKTLFDVLLPATGKHYDFWIPDDMCMQQAAQLVSQAMGVAEPDFYFPSKDAALLFSETGEIQDPRVTVAEIGFIDGDCFVLI